MIALKQLKVDGTEIDLKGKKLKLEEMQKLVGGYIELIALGKRQFMYVNEEGKLLNLPINKKATKILRESLPAYQALFDQDVIVGDVIICKE